MAPVVVGVSVYWPLGDSTPFQPDGTESVLPEAVQLVAFAAFHVKVELPPLPTVVGEAVKVTAALGVMTFMFTD